MMDDDSRSTRPNDGLDPLIEALAKPEKAKVAPEHNPSEQRILLILAGMLCILLVAAVATVLHSVPPMQVTDLSLSSSPSDLHSISTIESEPESDTEETESEIELPLNINTATAAELDLALPGIGEVLAERIVAYRLEHGAFQTIEALMDVNGIGEKTFEELKAYITVAVENPAAE